MSAFKNAAKCNQKTHRERAQVCFLRNVRVTCVRIRVTGQSSGIMTLKMSKCGLSGEVYASNTEISSHRLLNSIANLKYNFAACR